MSLVQANSFSWAVLRRPVSSISAFFLAIVLLAVVFAPILSPYDPLEQHILDALQGPSEQYLLGTDTLGRDVLSRILWGGRPALWGALEATAIFALIGVIFGMIAGYSRGVSDRIISSVVDVMGSLPSIVVVFAVLVLFGNTLGPAMISAGFFGSYGLIRIVRARTQETREELYVAAARISGLGPLRILAHHIFPRLINPIVVQLSIFFGIALVLQSGLGFLNLGVTPPDPSWGGMVGEGATVIQQSAWLILVPGCLIALTVLASIFLSDAFQDSVNRDAGVNAGTRGIKIHREPKSAESAEEHGKSPLLTVRNLNVDLPVQGGFKNVVRNVSFAIAPGELVGLVGESGSGKSVTALSLLGLLPADSKISAHELSFASTDLINAGMAGFRTLRGTGIGLVSQEPMVALDPSYTIGSQLSEVIRATGRNHTRRNIDEQVMAALRDVQLRDPETVAQKYPFELSGGMAQRCCIALALAGRPRLLIADEPTTALDVTVQAEILDLLRLMRDEHGMAVLLLTHNLGVVADFCERVLVMRSSELIEDQSVVNLFRQPRQEYTRALLQATPSLIDLSAARGATPSDENRYV